MCRSISNDSPYLMEPDYGADSGIWDDHLLQWSGYSEYLLGRYVQTCATSTRDFHLGPISVEGPYVTEAGHNPAVQTSCWEGRIAKGHSEHEGSGATGSSDGPSHLYSPRVDQQPRISSWCSHRVRLQDWESPLTPRPPSLPPLTVGTPMYMGDRPPEAEMMAIGLPAIPED